MQTFGRLSLAIAVVAAGFAFTEAAGAESLPGLKIDWGRGFQEGTDWLARNAERRPHAEMLALGEGLQTAPEPTQLGNAWFGASPRVSLVARDWGEARRLSGGPLMVTDQLRLSRSSRMVVSRLRLGGGRLVPFSQLGVGQWRIDTEVMPGHLRDAEVAVQFGGGVEARVTRAFSFALESDLTVLCRDVHEPQNIPTPLFWGAIVASRLEF